MSTQSSSFPAVPFSVTHPQQSLRLLELPPDLLELLTADNRPATLQLKSALPNTKNPPQATKAKDEYLHLCTKDKAWAIRQVSTSNSVYITTPASTTSAGQPTPSPRDTTRMEVDNTAATTETGMTAISQPTSSLELIPASATQSIAEDTIRALLSLHPLPDSEEGEDFFPDQNAQHWEIDGFLNDLPFPTNVMKRALRNLFVFQPKGPTAYIPTPQLLLQAYRHFYTSFCAADRDSTGTNGDLAKFDVLYAGDVKTSVFADEGEVMACVVDSILDKFVQVDDVKEGEDEEEIREMYSLSGPLRGKELTLWLGGLLVQDAGSAGIDKSKLVGEWQNLLPRAWWGYCDVDSVGEGYVGVDGRVKWVETKTSEVDVQAGEGGTSSAAATGKRKWHEKFAAERNKK